MEFVNTCQKKLRHKKFQKIQFKFLSVLKLHSVLVFPTTKFDSILVSSTTKFHSISMSPTTKFQFIQMSPTNKRFPSPNRGTLGHSAQQEEHNYTIYCTLYNLHCKLYAFPSIFFQKTSTQSSHETFPSNFSTEFVHPIFLPNFSTQFSTKLVCQFKQKTILPPNFFTHFSTKFFHPIYQPDFTLNCSTKVIQTNFQLGFDPILHPICSPNVPPNFSTQIFD